MLSDMVEHEVMSTYRDRWAITLWAYANDTLDAPPTLASSSPTFSRHLSPPRLSSEAAQDPWKAATCPALLESRSLIKPPDLLSVPAIEDPVSASQQREATIFVSIISYRDSELPHTVRDLFLTATHPDRVKVGIVYQLNSAADDATCRLLPEHLSDFDELTTDSTAEGGKKSRKGEFYHHHVRTLSLPHTEAKGPIFARHLAASLYGGENFVLQIDSHMRFRRGWDAYLIHLLETIEQTEGCDKVVLSTYPLGYHLPNQVPEDTRPTILVSKVTQSTLIFYS